MSWKLRVPNLQNVAPGNTATLTLPVGGNAPTLDKILLELSGGLLPAHIQSIRGKANGRLFMDEVDGTTINARDAYRGIFTSNSFVTIDFTEPKARNGAVEQLLASVPMSQLNSLQFEIKLASNAPALGRIDAQMTVRQPTQNPYIVKKLNRTDSFSHSGEQIMWLPTGGAGGKLKRIWIHEQGTAGTITGAEIRIGNNVAWESNRAKLEHDQKQNDLTPQAGIVVMDFVADGNLSGVLDTGRASTVELRLESSAANNYQVFYEFIDPIGRL